MKLKQPDWLNEEGLKTLNKGYLLPGEDINKAWRRVCKQSNKYIELEGFEEDLFDCLYNGFIGLASPVLSNFGTTRGLPISCYSVEMPDEINGMGSQIKHLMNLSKNGGGVGCVNGETEYLTPYGWKAFKDYIEGDLVAEYNINTDSIKYVKPLEFIKVKSEELNHIKTNRGIDQILCDNHRILYFNESSKKNMKPICVKSMIEKHIKNKRGFRGLFKHAVSKIDNKGLNYSDDELRLIVAIQADGSLPSLIENNKHQYKKNYTRFGLKKERKKERLIKILNKLNINFKRRDYEDGKSLFTFHCPHPIKFFPNEFYQLNTHQLDIIIEECLYWDGSKGYKNRIGCYYSSIKSNADFIQFAGTITNRRSNLLKYNKEDKIEYRVNFTNNVYCGLSKDNRSVKNPEIQKIKTTDGFKYCFKVSSDCLILRCNNKIFLTYNCDWNNIRPAGSLIKNNGKTNGSVPFAVLTDRVASTVSQGSTRRGSFAHYWRIDHPDVKQALLAKDHNGDIRGYIDGNIALSIPDWWMIDLINGDKNKAEIMNLAIKTRLKTGSPYFFFVDTVNRLSPDAYKLHNLICKTSNICCLTGDTLVATKKGHLPIKELVGKEVEIFDGKNWVKNSSFEFKGYSETYDVLLESGQIISMTYNHRCLLKDGSEKWASKLLPGDHLAYANEFSQNNNGIEEPGAYLKGFLIGDGSKGGYLNLHSTKYCCENLLLLSAKELSIKEKTQCKITKLNFSDEINITNKYKGVWGNQIFKKLEGLRSRNITKWCDEYKYKLPEEIFSWSKKSKLLFLSGLFDADATGNGDIQFHSRQPQLLNDIQRLLHTIGYRSRLDNYHRLLINRIDGYKLFKELSTQRLECTIKKPNRSCRQHNKVVSVTLNTELKDVYCPVIPSTTYFSLANGVMTGNTEITLYTDPNHTFVCCLSSQNDSKYDLIKKYKTKNLNLTVPEVAVYLLDSVISDFIIKCNNNHKYPSMGRALRSAKKGRAIGYGTMGLADLFQQKGLMWGSQEALDLDLEIHSWKLKMARKASMYIAERFGQPEWCIGTPYAHTHLLACAPTKTNAAITNSGSEGVSPYEVNCGIASQAKGNFLRKNRNLIPVFEKYGINNYETWNKVAKDNGSILDIPEIPIKEKLVFLNARELDQCKTIIKHGSVRQPQVDQGVSINTFASPYASVKSLLKVIIEAWAYDLKTLYYLKSSSSTSLENLMGKAHIITKKGCQYCELSKKLFKKHNYTYIEYDIIECEDNFIWDTVPVIWADGHFIGGFMELTEYFEVLFKEGNKQSLSFQQTNIEDCLNCQG